MNLLFILLCPWKVREVKMNLLSCPWAVLCVWLCLVGSHSFQFHHQVTPQGGASLLSRTTSVKSPTRTILYESAEDDRHDEDGTEKAGAKNATTALLLDNIPSELDPGVAVDVDQASLMGISEAPPLTFSKFLTMQDKRVNVTIRFSGEAGLKPYFLTAAKKIKASHPDVILERRQMADVDKEDPTDEPSFDILVDGKVIVGNAKDLSRSQSIFVSMQELDLAISRARRRRRPSTTVYGEDHEPADVQQNSLRLQRLREGDVPPAPTTATPVVKKNRRDSWND